MTTFAWQELTTSPEEPGIYAWYYRPSLSSFDVDRLLEQLNVAQDVVTGRRLVREFLSKRLLSYFEEPPYTVRVSGALKANYEGEIAHSSTISDSLIERLHAEPQRIRELATVLPRLAPNFTAPLYVGMASNLRRRLTGHKRYIETLLEGARLPEGQDSERSRDHSFAEEVYNRGMRPAGLQVMTLALPEEQAAIAVDVENLLNRLNYPVLGRN